MELTGDVKEKVKEEWEPRGDVTFCPMCGVGVSVDERGCCLNCNVGRVAGGIPALLALDLVERFSAKNNKS